MSRLRGGNRLFVIRCLWKGSEEWEPKLYDTFVHIAENLFMLKGKVFHIFLRLFLLKGLEKTFLIREIVPIAKRNFRQKSLIH